MQKTLKQQAQQYEPPKTKNIADLEKVSVDVGIVEKKYKEGTEDEFSVNVIVVNDEDYRVPDSVLKNLKVILESKPSLKYFKVVRTGEGMKTTYTIVPLD
ncbi:MAG: hypothetical protein AABY22_08840 [Nanoarchaeota archaeon]